MLFIANESLYNNGFNLYYYLGISLTRIVKMSIEYYLIPFKLRPYTLPLIYYNSCYPWYLYSNILTNRLVLKTIIGTCVKFGADQSNTVDLNKNVNILLSVTRCKSINNKEIFDSCEPKPNSCVSSELLPISYTQSDMPI